MAVFEHAQVMPIPGAPDVFAAIQHFIERVQYRMVIEHAMRRAGVPADVKPTLEFSWHDSEQPVLVGWMVTARCEVIE